MTSLKTKETIAMNEQQIRATIKQLQQQLGKKYKAKTEEEINEMILDMFFQAFCEDHISREDLTAFTEIMGYRVNDDILDEIEKQKKEQ